MDIIQIKKEIKNIKRTKFGISIPELKKLARKIAKDNGKEFLDQNRNKTYELKLLHAFVLGYLKDDIRILIEYFKNFMPKVDDWAVCDSLCQSFKVARNYPDIVWDFLMKYKNSKKEFESRIVAVMLLSHYLNDDYIDNVIDILNNLNTDDYYSKMGVAWAIATVMGKYPNKCLNYLKSGKCKLDNSTYNKSLQKIRESYRVSADIKEIIKTYRK